MIESDVAPALRVSSVLPYDRQQEAELAVNLVKDYTMVTFPRLATTYQMAVFCETAQLPGAFVECGVWKGGSAAILALANLAHGADRRPIHLFDSFTDICQPDERVDGARAVQEAREWGRETGPLTGELRPMSGVYSALGGPGTVAEVRALIEQRMGYDPASVRYHEGWFQHTLPHVAPTIGPIALLRLDADYYASTRVCLEHLFDLVVPGGFVIFDDYGYYEGCRRAVDEFLQERGEHYFLHHVDSDGRYLIKR